MVRIPVLMEKGAGYLTQHGVKFTSDHPFQLVEEEHLDELLGQGKFRVSTAEEIRSYYNLDSTTMKQEE